LSLCQVCDRDLIGVVMALTSFTASKQTVRL
jgi:hypothetical protein